MSLSFKIHTLGCKVNQYESQRMAELLVSNGYNTAAEDERADLLIVNSCTVTATADQKTRQLLRRLRRENPNAVICLSGCMPQAFPEDAAKLLEADIVIGNSNRDELPELVSSFMSSCERHIQIEQHGAQSGLSGCVSAFGERTRAYIKIEDGCNRFCSYCIIPYARGRVRSRDLGDIKSELDALAKDYREIVLTGINLSAFGSDNGLSLYDAVLAAADTDGIERIRLGSLEPDMLSASLLSKLAQIPKLCPQFHLSLQSGCDETLKRMNRRYTSAEYFETVAQIRALFDNPSITTDVMVGFPGETDEEFEKSLAFVERVGFLKTHCFIYSRRSGTPAAARPDQLPNAVKKLRSERLIAVSNAASESFYKAQIGAQVELLLERELSPGLFEGYSKNYTPVFYSGSGNRGEIVRCTITGCDENGCTA